MNINNCNKYIVFKIETQHYALSVNNVERTFNIVEITPLPDAPDIILGIINVHGKVIPVLNIYKRFNQPEHEINIRDRLIIIKTPLRELALIADFVTGVIEVPGQNIADLANIHSGTSYIKGSIKCKDGLILITDIEQFLTSIEESTLNEALTRIKNGV